MIKDKLKLIFMGTPLFAAKHLEELLKYKNIFDIAAVYTRPDKPKGRSKKILPSEVKNTALKNNLKVIQIDNFRTDESVAELESYKPDILVIVAYGLILNEKVLKIPSYGAINIHASLLPRWRGAAPIQYSLMAGDKLTGVTSFLLNSGIDTGNILLQKELCVSENDDCESLSRKLSVIGSECLIETLYRIKESNLQFKGFPQDNEGASCTGKIKKEMACIDFSKDASELHNQVRALNVWPVVTAELAVNNKVLPVKIFKTVPVIPCCSCCSGAKPGEISFNDGKNLHIKTGNGCLSILELQVPDKKRMGVSAFLNGYKISTGTTVSPVRQIH